ncbi:MAG: 4Fe-4S dicluster domain-containing protein [Candidatus Sumerlaeia bacterium]|nr:4Fe-4S dicluster domain-containing protein [Candidatus Sumerlaeia bacterium]
MKVRDQVKIKADDLQKLLTVLLQQGYRVVGPTVRDNVLVYDDLATVKDLPIGWTDEQEGGTFRLRRRNDEAYFGFVGGQHSWKQFLYPPVLRLWRAKREHNKFKIIPEKEPQPQFAFFGVRPCDLNAITIQDRVLLQGEFKDVNYGERRARTFIIAVNCAKAGKTCFCVSMKSGPKATSGYDLALTEIIEDKNHYFVVEAGTEAGVQLLRKVPHTTATEQDVRRAEQVVENTVSQMGRAVNTDQIQELLYKNDQHPYWGEVAKRCLACTNCTMVCPTCFCVNIEDVTDIAGEYAERWRKIDSCFNIAFTYIVGGSVRTSPESRYRHWVMHKLATWRDQFGTFGCVGCGRCITWCPVGIDITEVVRNIRERSRTT